MRGPASFLVALLLLWAACTPTTSPDEDCIVAGGVCFSTAAQEASPYNACTNPIAATCSNGFSCCAVTAINAVCVADGGVSPDCSVPEAGTDATDARSEARAEAAAASDSATDGAPADAAKADAVKDGAKDAAAKDATTKG